MTKPMIEVGNIIKVTQDGVTVGENRRLVRGVQYVVLKQAWRSAGGGVALTHTLVEVGADRKPLKRKPFTTMWLRAEVVL